MGNLSALQSIFLVVILLLGSRSIDGQGVYVGESEADPSTDQLDLLYDQKATIGEFENLVYWSSKETDANNAASKGFTTGFNLGSTGKGTEIRARAIRAF